MPAAATDKFKKATAVFSTTLNGSISSGATTLTLNSTAGLPTDTAVILTIDATDANATATPGTKEVIIGTVSGSTITNLVRGVEGTQQLHSSGAVVVDYVTAKHWNDLLTALLTVHNQDGSMVANLPLITPALTSPTSTGGTLTTPTIVSPTNTGINSGWIIGLTAPSTVTALGNRSYSVVINTTDYTDRLSVGARLKFTRTVTAPTQCTSLNGSSQYFNKTSPAGMTFTDDPTFSAWVKLSSYAAGSLISRYNGTSGFDFGINASGQLYAIGFNAGSANFSQILSSTIIPLNRWVHVAAELDMSAFTNTATTSYLMIDGLDVTGTVTRGGTNPTALVQAGNLEIGSRNGGTNFFPGKIAQVAIYSAHVTQATILASMHQTLSGSETSLISAYSFNNTINDLNANANNLTAQGSAVATNADSPFAGGGNASTANTAGTTEFGEISAISFSTNTTLTVMVPDGYALPTSGGISALAYSAQYTPVGWPGGLITLGMAQIGANFTTTSASAVQVTGLGVTVSAPTGRRLKITVVANVGDSTAAQTTLSLWDGVVASGTQLQGTFNGAGASTEGQVLVAEVTPSAAGSKTYNVGLLTSAGTATLFSSVTAPATIMVEVV